MLLQMMEAQAREGVRVMMIRLDGLGGGLVGILREGEKGGMMVEVEGEGMGFCR